MQQHVLTPLPFRCLSVLHILSVGTNSRHTDSVSYPHYYMPQSQGSTQAACAR